MSFGFKIKVTVTNSFFLKFVNVILLIVDILKFSICLNTVFSQYHFEYWVEHYVT